MLWFASLAAIIVLNVIDRVTKLAVVSAFSSGGSKEFLFGLFRLTYVENTGAAFSSFSDNTLLLSLFTSAIIVVCIVVLFLNKNKSRFFNISLILVISGGIGNEIDRFAHGYVVDFIEPLFMKFAVFNFADCCITVGAFMLLAYEIYASIRDEKAKRSSKENEDRNDD